MNEMQKKSFLITLNRISVGNSKFYGINMGKVLGQISTGGGGAQLEEQLSAIDCPSMRSQTYTNIEKHRCDILEREVTSELLAAREEEKRIAKKKNSFIKMHLL